MFHARLHVKFLVMVLGILAVLLGAMSYVIVQREARLLARKSDERQHLLAFTIFSDLERNMMNGTPRSTLALMSNLRGAYGLVRLETLRRDGSRAFGSGTDRLTIPQLESVFDAEKEVSFLEEGKVPLHTILLPLKNEQACIDCHGQQKKVLGVLLISLSREDTLREIKKSKQRLTSYLFALILLIGGVLYIVLRQVVLKPLATLHHGAELIGNGLLSHRIHLDTQDEIQELAGAFNVMAGQLESSHAGLEQKIAERTVQLSDAKSEVEDKAQRLYYHSRDMATISRLSTKIFNAGLTQDQLLDWFMRGVNRGLGYKRAMLCLVDRKRSWLDMKRDTGVGSAFPFTSQPMSGNDPLVRLTRAGKPVVLDDVPGEAVALAVIPILRHIPRMCWQARSCIKTDCPAYEEREHPCWQMPDTLCQNELMASYHDKLSYCMTCEVFPVVGVLIVAVDRKKRSLRGRSMSVLRILASEMGAAIENHWLHDENQQMVKELLELHKVTAASLLDLSLDKALETFADSSLKFSGLDSCNFWLRSKDGQMLVRKSGGCLTHIKGDSCPVCVPLDAGPLGRAFSENSVVLDYDAAAATHTPLGQALSAHGLLSLLAIPLSIEGRPVGVFSVHKQSTLPFLESEVAAFMLLANQAALVINVCALNEEMKDQNRELARHMSLLSGILSSMSSGVLLLDESGMVTLINQAGAMLFQTQRENLVNRRLRDLFPETSAFSEESMGVYREIEIPLPDGSVVPIGYSSTYYRGVGGDHEGVIVVFRDLTDIRVLQAELINKERFAAMGRVVAGVAHEIRNPLFGISSIGQIFERELQNPNHLELVRALLSETRRLNQLVEELLIYGRPMKLKLEECDLHQLWDEVLGMHRDEAERRGIRITEDFGIDHPIAYIDAHQVRQVFLNLFRNAIEATPSGGQIAIRLLLEDRFLIYHIADTGAGIPAVIRDRVFDLFFTTKPKGTGLGLAICKKIIQDHGGEISIESEEGRGTAVTVRLPSRVVLGRPDSLTPT